MFAIKYHQLFLEGIFFFKMLKYSYLYMNQGAAAIIFLNTTSFAVDTASLALNGEWTSPKLYGAIRL